MVNRHIRGTRFVNKSVESTTNFEGISRGRFERSRKKKKENEEWKIVESNGEKKKFDPRLYSGGEKKLRERNHCYIDEYSFEKKVKLEK